MAETLVYFPNGMLKLHATGLHAVNETKDYLKVPGKHHQSVSLLNEANKENEVCTRLLQNA